MSYPDFNEDGYQILRELGRNREGGRITWLASKVDTGEQVVVKQFCFAQAGSSWSGFKAYEKEIQFLQELNHPGIPHYLSSFDRPDGFCLVQEYINAPSLVETHSFAPEEIKQIAVKALEILVYLQNRIPPIIHRDIKPENILVDEQLNVYIIDFGFARVGSQEVAASSVFRGTPGFIPPEQMFKPTDATDLYALGATLICLLTGIKSTKIYQLQDQDDPYLIKFHHLLPQLSLRFLDWLEKMVQPLQKNRFANAKSALEALKPLDVIRVAVVDFSQTVLEFKANRLGQKLTQSITVENPIQDTLLEARWEVEPHNNDPPHTPDYHAWISVTPAEFSGNDIRCQVQIDTSKLMADKQYKRQLILHSNAYPQTRTLTVKVQTATLSIEKRELPYIEMMGVFLIFAVFPIVLYFLNVTAINTGWYDAYPALFGATVFGCLVGFITGSASVAGSAAGWMTGGFGFITYVVVAVLFKGGVFNDLVGAVAMLLLTIGGLLAGPWIGGWWSEYLQGWGNTSWKIKVQSATITVLGSLAGALVGSVIGNCLIAVSIILFNEAYPFLVLIVEPIVVAIITSIALVFAKEVIIEGIFTTLVLLLTAGVGISLGIGWKVGLFNQYILLALAFTGLPLATMLSYLPLKQRILIAKYRKFQQNLIKP
ncbi:protein kinase [Desmonostoc muscorum CCALA 125]|nr:protein kinase [Desmonostoc muscorum CCALA 125]